MKIRPATPVDVPRMLELVRELALFEKAPEKVTVSEDEFKDAGFGNSPVYQAWVIQDGDFIPAFALCYIRYSTWEGRKLYLEDLLVTESYRGRGLGSLLFETCLQEVVKQNLGGLSWQVLDWNESAIEFYKKYGSALDAEWLNGSLSSAQARAIIQNSLQSDYKTPE